MDELEKLKLDAIREETRKKGRKLTGLEALEIEKQVHEAYLAKHPDGKKNKNKNERLPISNYRFD